MTRKTKRLRGGQRTITDEVMAELFEWTAEGKTIRGFCAAKKHSRTQVQERLKEPGFAEPIARARELGEQVIIDEMIEIADEGDELDVQRRKLKLWMREKQLVWNNPSKYGQKTQVEKTITHRIELTDVERDIRIDQLLAIAKRPEITVVPTEEEEETSDEQNHD